MHILFYDSPSNNIIIYLFNIPCSIIEILSIQFVRELFSHPVYQVILLTEILGIFFVDLTAAYDCLAPLPYM